MDDNLRRRLQVIADQGRVRGVTLSLDDTVDPVVMFAWTRRILAGPNARQALSRRAVVIEDIVKALRQVADIYNVHVHVKVPVYHDNESELLRSLRFRNNMLCELSDGTFLNLERARLFTYRGSRNGN